MTSIDRGFGELLRGWRDRTTPASVGLTTGSRRTPGLRREELASLAGLSVDYVVRLEQGRGSHPSAQVVAAISRALKLSDSDTALLHRAAGLAEPVGTVCHIVPLGVERLIQRMADMPVAVFSADWWLLTWNTMWAALQGDPSSLIGRDRNLVWYVFSGGSSRVRKSPAEDDAFRDSLVSDLRLTLIEHPTDRNLGTLVAELRRGNPDFESRWEGAHVGRHQSARKTIDHPRVGELTLDCDVLAAAGSDVHVVMYSAAPDTEDASRLDLLRVLGTEAFAV